MNELSVVKVKAKKRCKGNIGPILRLFLTTSSKKSPCIKLIKIRPRRRALAM